MLPAFLRRLLDSAVLRQGGLVLLDQGLLSFTNFLTGVLVARACTTGEYGVYVLVWSALIIALSFYNALVNIPFTVFLPRLSAEEGNRFQGSALLQTVLIALASGLLMAATVALGPSAGREVASAAMVIGLLFAPFLLREFARNALFTRLQFRSSIGVSVLATGAQLATVGFLFFTGRLGMVSALWVILGTSALAGGLMLWMHRDQMEVRPSQLLADMRRGWHVSRWSLLNVAGMIGVSQVYPWLLVSLNSASDVAIYGAAAAMAGAMVPFVQAANSYVQPRMSHSFKAGDVATLRRMLRRSMLGLAIPHCVWVVVGGLFADPLMSLLYSDRYAGFGAVVVLLLFRSAVEAMSAQLNSALQTLERTDVITAALFVGTLVTLTVGWYAVANHGLVGAAVASLLTTLATAGYKFLRFSRIVR
jgi:O-antigen/teichoic acid export membrane protein